MQRRREILQVRVTFEHNPDAREGDGWLLLKSPFKEEGTANPRIGCRNTVGMFEEKWRRTGIGGGREAGDEVRKVAGANSNSPMLWQGLLALI